MNNALKKSVDRILDLAINEDQTKHDLTSSLTLTNKKIKADIVFKEKGILSCLLYTSPSPRDRG